MPVRKLVSEKMAEFLSGIANQHRIRIIEELHAKEHNVNSLQAILGTSHSVVSQHLSILKAHKIVQQRKVGNQVFYQLTQRELASWLLEGLEYLEGGLQSEQAMRLAVNEVKIIWDHESEKRSSDDSDK